MQSDGTCKVTEVCVRLPDRIPSPTVTLSRGRVSMFMRGMPASHNRLDEIYLYYTPKQPHITGVSARLCAQPCNLLTAKKRTWKLGERGKERGERNEERQDRKETGKRRAARRGRGREGETERVGPESSCPDCACASVRVHVA
eukprot:1313404-Rhodomonas_salina.1